MKTKGYKAISTGIRNKPAQPGLRWLARLVALSFLGLLITACEREAFVMNSPPILVSPDEFLDFGELPLGYTATRKIQMVNAGGQPLSIDDYIALSDENVFMATFERETIAPGASVSVSITFTPAVEQRYEGVLRVKSNTADGEEVQISLRGTGLSDVVCGDCESPPGDICEDDNTLLTYNRDGECAEDVCRYVKERIDCPYGCEAGICLGAVVMTDGGVMDAGENPGAEAFDSGHEDINHDAGTGSPVVSDAGPPPQVEPPKIHFYGFSHSSRIWETAGINGTCWLADAPLFELQSENYQIQGIIELR